MYVVFDVESKKIFDEVEDRDPRKLGISYMAYYRSDTDTLDGFFDEDVPKFKEILDKADLVVGFNTIEFDFPVLDGYFPVKASDYHQCDLFQIIAKKHDVYLKLDNVTESTLGGGKIAHGLDAIRFWREGKLDKLKEYCDSDVQLTKDLYEYILKNKHFFYTDGLGNKVRLELDLEEELEKLKPKKYQEDAGGLGLF